MFKLIVFSLVALFAVTSMAADLPHWEPLPNQKVKVGGKTVEMKVRRLNWNEKDGIQVVVSKASLDHKISVDSIVYSDGTYSLHELDLQTRTGKTRYPTGVVRYFATDRRGNRIKDYYLGLKRDQIYTPKGKMLVRYKTVKGDTVFADLAYDEVAESFKRTVTTVPDLDEVPDERDLVAPRGKTTEISGLNIGRDTVIIDNLQSVLVVSEGLYLRDGDLSKEYRMFDYENHSADKDSAVFSDGTYQTNFIQFMTNFSGRRRNGEERMLRMVGPEILEEYAVNVVDTNSYGCSGQVISRIKRISGDTIFYDVEIMNKYLNYFRDAPGPKLVAPQTVDPNK